jgi:hypothetical protein
MIAMKRCASADRRQSREPDRSWMMVLKWVMVMEISPLVAALDP